MQRGWRSDFPVPGFLLHSFYPINSMRGDLGVSSIFTLARRTEDREFNAARPLSQLQWISQVNQLSQTSPANLGKLLILITLCWRSELSVPGADNHAPSRAINFCPLPPCSTASPCPKTLRWPLSCFRNRALVLQYTASESREEELVDGCIVGGEGLSAAIRLTCDELGDAAADALTEKYAISIPHPQHMKNKENYVVILSRGASRRLGRNFTVCSGVPSCSFRPHPTPSLCRTPGAVRARRKNTRFLTRQSTESARFEAGGLTSTRTRKVIHTLDWPLPRYTYGGREYHMADRIGLVVGLDHKNPYVLEPVSGVSAHEKPPHPSHQRRTVNARRMHPHRRRASGALLGCAAGMMNVARTSMLAGEAAFAALHRSTRFASTASPKTLTVRPLASATYAPFSSLARSPNNPEAELRVARRSCLVVTCILHRCLESMRNSKAMFQNIHECDSERKVNQIWNLIESFQRIIVAERQRVFLEGIQATR
ncbi:hypothetical protein C8R45DRAFT_1179210 [Mycena sanguinolenta]|nr:hypothetical protein C8R45DRAFT_1179210 [Mycena sanguinolenta]